MNGCTSNLIGHSDHRTLRSKRAPRIGWLARDVTIANRVSKVLSGAVLLLCCGCSLLDTFLGHACVDLPLDDTLQTGIRGTVTIGPTCPVEQPGEVCVEPYEADLRIECADGSDILTVRSDADGEFEVRLPPGEYHIVPLQPDPASPFPVASPVDVVVPAEGSTEVHIDYDTGIR